MRFHNGSQVEYEDCAKCDGEGVLPPVLRHAATIVDERPCPSCGGEKVKVLVTRPHGGTARYRLDDDGEMHRAYAMALNGPAPKPQPQSKRDFGDDPPF